MLGEFLNPRFGLGVKVLKVNPTTGYVTVDLSKADTRTRRMLRDADDRSYYLYEEPGKPAVLQVKAPPSNQRSK